MPSFINVHPNLLMQTRIFQSIKLIQVAGININNKIRFDRLFKFELPVNINPG